MNELETLFKRLKISKSDSYDDIIKKVNNIDNTTNKSVNDIDDMDNIVNGINNLSISKSEKGIHITLNNNNIFIPFIEEQCRLDWTAHSNKFFPKFIF